ncbi:PREDICTED: gibberellin 2-beta-dioxygenase 2 [Tarenaya hassleriana]|uniref:gibberellin 2-beta-dioxygenase 2 n=1 Tax=Tarenaya hassleriana TaxID=28532 RepID=UPI00053C55E4|nr:PREDICTED: gibberellin 2-beta-dioxygenase 2 [Tarenaya hassleriana]
MVVLSQPVTLDNHVSVIPTCRPVSVQGPVPVAEIPMVDLTDPEAKTRIVEACVEFGFFKVVNHGVRPELMTRLEHEAIRFFALPQSSKDKAGPPDPFGYGSKRIGPNGDVGWIEYILLNANPQVISLSTLAVFRQTPPIFRAAVEEYMTAVKAVACEVLEKMAEGLGIEPADRLSKLVKDEKSDSCLRLNHYPAAAEETAAAEGRGREVVGFGEHTDPQVISVLRSNNTTGLQICLKGGSWVAVPPDHSSFFINVGDALQVMTNGKFKSVKHRVLADTRKSRVSMIYFGGPPLNEKIAPLTCLVPNQDDRLYKEFTWSQYKSSAYKTRLGDYRLGPFEKNPLPQSEGFDQ